VEDKLSNKLLILKAAEQLFVEHGFAETKIADISSAVGISDSTVYEHFENKQDILFTIPQEYTRDLIRINEEHLGGLVGAEVKLRKLIWNYLEFLTNHRSYSHILIFELRPNRGFYEHKFKSQLYDFISKFRESIMEGQENNEFRSELLPSHILKLIFGTLDLILITWLIKNTPEKPTDMFEPFFDLLIRAIARRNSQPRENDKRKLILDAAAAIFAEIGYQKARIQDIAKSAGVADGTIYQYFKNKQEILFTLPLEKTRELLSIQKEHLNGIKNPELRLQVLIADYLRFFDANRDYSSIVLFELRYNRNFYTTPAYELFREFARTFYEVIKEGVELKHFRASVHPFIASQMIFGIIDHSLLTWLLFKKPNAMADICDDVYDLIIHALKN